jgi:hypothetical protein
MAVKDCLPRILAAIHADVESSHRAVCLTT